MSIDNNVLSITGVGDAIEQNGIYEFYADWCLCCRNQQEVLSHIDNMDNFYQVNVNQEPLLTEAYNVHLLPTFLKIEGGEEIGRSEGYMERSQLESWIDSFIH